MNTQLRKSESLLTAHLHEREGWDANEATMVAQVLAQILGRVRPPVDLVAETELKVRLGRGIFCIDTAKGKEKQPRGRADFVLRDPETGRVLIVVEAKPPGESLSDDDGEQLGSYMGAVRPLAPYGILTNGQEVRVYTWQDGMPLPTPGADELTTSIEIGLNEATEQEAVQRLLSFSSIYRDQVLTEMSRGQLAQVSPPSRSPRRLVAELAGLIEVEPRGIHFVTSPPRCGKTRVLRDLAEVLKQSPLLFAPSTDSSRPLSDALQDFDLKLRQGESPVVSFLRARDEDQPPLVVLVDVVAASLELSSTLAWLAASSDIAVHAVVVGSNEVLRGLLYHDDFRPRFDDAQPVSIYELGAFADEELQAIFPDFQPALLARPFWRLVRWPGLYTAHEGRAVMDVDLSRALARWFRELPDKILQALQELGRALAENPDGGLDRIPPGVTKESTSALLGYGLAVWVPTRATRIARLACVEIGLYALLSHVFEIDEVTPPRAVLQRVVDRGRPETEAETTALIALLPFFLEMPEPANPAARIAHRMVLLAFASYALDGLGRRKRYAELGDDVRALVRPSHRFAMADEWETMHRGLLRVRELLGMMPDFRELEEALGARIRRFGDRSRELARLRLSAETLVERRTLERLAAGTLLDVLDLVASGDLSWLASVPSEDEIDAVADAVREQIPGCSSQGLPIEATRERLNRRITRNAPEDVVALVRAANSVREPLAFTPHRQWLVELAVNAYERGQWLPLADLFAYWRQVPPWMQPQLLEAVASQGSTIGFMHVFLNGLQSEFTSMDGQYRSRVLERLIEVLGEEPSLAVAVSAQFLDELQEEGDPEPLERLRRCLSRSPAAPARARALAFRPAGGPQERVDALVELLYGLEQPDLWSVLTSDVAPKFAADAEGLVLRLRADADGDGPNARKAALALELASLLCWSDAPVVPSTLRPRGWPQLAGCARELAAHSELSWRWGDLSWDDEGCKACAKALVSALIQTGHHHELERTLRAALLNVHESPLNRWLVFYATEHRADAPQGWSERVLRRLVLSGFDLWIQPVGHPAMPMLSTVIERHLRGVGEDRRDELCAELALFILARWHRIEQLPLAEYTANQVLGTKVLGRMVFGAVISTLGKGRGLRNALNFLTLAAGTLTEAARVTAREAISAYLAGHSEARPQDALDEEWTELLRLLGGEVGEAMPDAARVDPQSVLDAVERIVEVVPKLPEIEPAWSGRGRERSMLSPQAGGFRRWGLGDFADSLRG
ncbi:MAG: hypothetical protein EVA89_00420 [Sandaracinaceae bacterium]|nr:MAG: hypothetical protein EVA89_00420 [Sandaracinaceae bacterium]